MCFIFLSIFLLTTGDFLSATSSSTSVEDVGTYPITYSYYDEETGLEKEKTVYVTLTRDKTIINQEYQEAIDANDLLVEKGVLDEVTDEELIRMTNAKAWDVRTGNSLPIVVVELKVVNEAQGIYSVFYSTQAGTSVVIYIVEMEGYFVTGKNSYMNLTDFKMISKRQLYIIYTLVFVLLIMMVFVFIYSNKKLDDMEYVLYRK